MKRNPLALRSAILAHVKRLLLLVLEIEIDFARAGLAIRIAGSDSVKEAFDDIKSWLFVVFQWTYPIVVSFQVAC